MNVCFSLSANSECVSVCSYKSSLDSQTEILKVNTIVNAMVRDGVSHADRIPAVRWDITKKNTHVCICICSSFVCTASANQILFLIFGMISKMCIIKNDYLYQSKCDQLRVFRFVVAFFVHRITQIRSFTRHYWNKQIF